MNIAAHPVFQSLTPVFLLIGLGYLAGYRGWLRGEAERDLTNLVLYLLMPALLFRTMSSVRLESLDLTPIAVYFPAVLALLTASLVLRGFTCQSVVLALAGTFSNTVMIGITLVGLAYGQQGLVTLLTVVAVHALIVLTVGAILLELASARDVRARGGNPPHVLMTVWSSVRNSVLSPIPLPILSGLAFAQTGLVLPDMVDAPLHLLGGAFGALALVLVGISLAGISIGRYWQSALWISVSKNLLLPALVAAGALLMGVDDLVFAVLVVTAGIPTGANVVFFARQYRVAEETTVAAMGVSTLLGVISLSVIMLAVS